MLAILHWHVASETTPFLKEFVSSSKWETESLFMAYFFTLVATWHFLAAYFAA